MATEPIHPTRVCRKCGFEKPEDALHFRRRGNRLTHQCQDCLRAKCRAYYESNKSQMLARVRDTRATDPEFHRARDKAYYEKHLEVKKARVREYKSTRKDRYRELNRQWDAANPERKRELARQSYARRRESEIARVVEWTRQNRDKQTAARARRRGRVAGAEGVITSEDIAAQKARQAGLCYYCEIEPKRWEVEHFIPLARGGSNGPENMVMACAPCNRSKSYKLPWEWRPERFVPDSTP
jgi:5-methylcytosine-specific restriction endonuclease McrA